MKKEINPKKQIIGYCIWIILMILSAAYFFSVDNIGMAGGLIGSLLLPIRQIMRCVRIMKDPELKRQEDIEFNDERTKLISREAMRITGIIFLLACSVGAWVCAFLNRYDYCWFFASVFVFYIIVLLITSVVLNRKY